MTTCKCDICINVYGFKAPCPTCGEPFFPGQKYYDLPYKQHVMCRKYSEEFMLVGALMYEKHLRNQKENKE